MSLTPRAGACVAVCRAVLPAAPGHTARHPLPTLELHVGAPWGPAGQQSCAFRSRGDVSHHLTHTNRCYHEGWMSHKELMRHVPMGGSRPSSISTGKLSPPLSQSPFQMLSQHLLPVPPQSLAPRFSSVLVLIPSEVKARVTELLAPSPPSCWP